MKIKKIKTYPLTVPTDEDSKTSQGAFKSISILVVIIETNNGIYGIGEALARYAPKAYSELIDDLLAPNILNMNPFAVEAIWKKLFRTFTGKSGGILIEAISAIDIALWDIIGKETNKPVYEIMGHMNKNSIRTYASSIPWTDDEKSKTLTDFCLKKGFKEIKVKIGSPVNKAKKRIKLIRDLVGPDIKLMADANWIFDVDEAFMIGEYLSEHNYYWFEEPIIPEDFKGYKYLRNKLSIMLAAGESEHTAKGASNLINERLIGVIQPDVARSGGITETKKIALMADIMNVHYAPHVGASGGICVAASLHLAAAMPNFLTYECMIFKNPLRDDIVKNEINFNNLKSNGELPLPKGPGLGIELNMKEVEKWKIN